MTNKLRSSPKCGAGRNTKGQPNHSGTNMTFTPFLRDRTRCSSVPDYFEACLQLRLNSPYMLPVGLSLCGSRQSVDCDGISIMTWLTLAAHTHGVDHGSTF